MKIILTYLAGVIFGLIVLFVITYGSRVFSYASTPIVVKEVDKGIKCASMVTSDGAAISCWKE